MVAAARESDKISERTIQFLAQLPDLLIAFSFRPTRLRKRGQEPRTGRRKLGHARLTNRKPVRSVVVSHDY